MVDTEIIDFFIEETEELFDNINSTLLHGEESGDISKEEVDSLFRNIHTIKGGAGSVGLSNLSDYTHHLETFLDLVRDGEVNLNQNIIDFLIESISNMQDILEQEYSGTLDKDNISYMIDKLKNTIDSFVSHSKSSNNVKSPKTISETSMHSLTDIFESIFSMLEIVHSSNNPEDISIDELFRAIHTLKGSSQVLHLSYVPTYIHHIENILDEVRDDKVSYSLELNICLLNSISIAKEIIYLEIDEQLTKDRFQTELTSLQEEIDRFNNPITSVSLPFEVFNDEIDVQAFEIFDDEKDVQVEPFEIFDEPNLKKDTTIGKTVKDKDRDKLPLKHKPVQKSKKSTSSSSIRVNLDKIDSLMNRVGDLVITKSMLFQFSENIKEDVEAYKALEEKLNNLDRDIRELQESVMSVRMVPMESVYSRLPKMVRDLSKKLDKKVKFEHFGDNVEIDKMMVEGLMDPLTHIIRNSLDHGIETPKTRNMQNKEALGTLSITASQESGNIIISIKDDGAGIDIDKIANKAVENKVVTKEQLSKMSYEERVMLIFSPGLSTAKSVSDVSGRGVGMDVVMTNINKLGGKVEVKTEKNIGSEFNIILPLTLAILDGLNIEVGNVNFILPLNSIVESLQPLPHMIKQVSSQDREIVMLRDEFIPIIKLSSFFGINSNYKNFEDGMLIIVKSSQNKVALFVDNFLNQEQIVVKSLEKNYKKIKGIGAATIRGDGSIALILDVMNIIEHNRVTGV
jgi:two-component system chemotaxis sensor kinase CheA